MRLASGDGSGVVRVWNARSGRVLWTARQVGRVADVEFSPHGDAVVTAGPQGAVIWSASTGDRLHVLPSPLGDVKAVFSPDGRLVATAGSDSNGRLWFAASGSIYRVLRSHKAALTDIAFSRDGRLLATASVDHDARIWIVDTGVHWVLQRSVFGTLSSIGFDSSGRWVAASGPISVVVWSAVSGRQLFYLRGGKQVLTGATFAPGVPSIVSSSHDGTLRRFRCTVCVNLRELERLAHDRLKRAG